jgi:bacterioferritin-associated ferredoxin
MGVAIAGREAICAGEVTFFRRFGANAIAIHSHCDYQQVITIRRGRPMYICICNAIREKDLRSAALCCSGDAEAVYNSLGRQPQCRQCLDEAGDILSEERSACAMAA